MADSWPVPCPADAKVLGFKVLGGLGFRGDGSPGAPPGASPLLFFWHSSSHEFLRKSAPDRLALTLPSLS